MRNIVSYDDIAAPHQPAPRPPRGPPTGTGPYAGPHAVPHAGPSGSGSGAGPSKKRRRYNNQGQNHGYNGNGRVQQQHWDEPPSLPEQMNYDDSETAPPEVPVESAADADMEEEEESRELSHQDIWDDSALVDAWRSSEEEYEMMHGPGKGWKNEPVHKSPLWYNVPPSPSKSKPAPTPAAAPRAPSASADPADADADADGDSAPLDFATFVPSHDPTLAAAAVAASGGASVGRDEAFQKALGAMYWVGYWSAVYQGQHQEGSEAQGAEADGEDVEDEDEEEEEPDEAEVEGLISTQR